MEDELSAVLRELERRKRRAQFAAHTACAFPQQLRAVSSKAKRKILRCGRRAGKTVAVAIALLLAALELPVVPVLYVTMTRGNAKEIIWADLLRLNEEFGLGFVPHLAELKFTSPNGCEIQLRGAHTEKEIAKMRGKRFKLVIVDEAQSIPDRVLQPLLKDVIGPTLLDFGGELWLVGTPPPVRAGIFWESYAGKLAAAREQHHWTVKDNTALPRRMQGVPIEEILKDFRDEYGWTEEDPTYRREVLGEDIEDLQSLLFQCGAAAQYTDLPTLQRGQRWITVFGIDIGADDDDAISVQGWLPGQRKVYQLDEYACADEDVSDLARVIVEKRAIWKPISMVIDQGGGGKKSVLELRRRHGLPMLEAAEKAEKGAYIRMFNADMRKGLWVAHADSMFVADAKLVRVDPVALMQGKLQELPAAKGGYHSDITDAALYGWRKARGYLQQAEIPAPPRTPEVIAAELQAKRRAAVEKRKGATWLDQQAKELGYDADGN